VAVGVRRLGRWGFGLQRYADDVGAVRSTAVEAVQVYRQYCSAVTEVAVAGGVAEPQVSGPMSVGMRGGQLQSAPDLAAAKAADALRRRALELLERARAAVAGAGDVAAAAMVAAGDDAPEARRFWEARSALRRSSMSDTPRSTRSGWFRSSATRRTRSTRSGTPATVTTPARG
jgi:hypothetical protein